MSATDTMITILDDLRRRGTIPPPKPVLHLVS
jgi:hypothetical protein